ncbi:MAG: SDR family NAD(P)-dependent oxidoreductase [Desulfobacterales bacterium]|nr:SDR family NAD(P)-dependent oxidoreductase [Desulfobacterales bacterium]
MKKIAVPDIRLDGRVVIVTGADRGLGRGMSLGLARAGATVMLASPEMEGLKAVAAEIGSLGAGRALVQVVDITDFSSCRALVRKTLAQTGRLDVLVNNARRLHRGPGIPSHGNSLPVFETDPEIYRQTVQVNVIGTFFMSRAALDHFREQGKGKIINLTTSARHFYHRHDSPYGVTKAALEASTQIWARDLEESGITVNSLLPGGSTDSDPDRPQKPGQVLLPVSIMCPPIIWLASELSDGVNGCRFVAKKWDASLPPARAAEAAREEPVFTGQPLGTFHSKIKMERFSR